MLSQVRHSLGFGPLQVFQLISQFSQIPESGNFFSGHDDIQVFTSKTRLVAHSKHSEEEDPKHFVQSPYQLATLMLTGISTAAEIPSSAQIWYDLVSPK